MNKNLQKLQRVAIHYIDQVFRKIITKLTKLSIVTQFPVKC